MLSIIKEPGLRLVDILKMDRRASGALEYGLLVLFIAIAIIGAVTNLGTPIVRFFNGFATTVISLAR